MSYVSLVTNNTNKANIMENRPHISTNEAAKALGCTSRTVVRMFNDNKLAGFKVSPRIIRIYKDAVVNILEGANNEPNRRNA